MAYLRNFNCKECGKNKHEIVHNSGICSDCRGKSYTKKKRVHLAGLKGLTVEERLDKIEENLYDLEIDQRISRLENRWIEY